MIACTRCGRWHTDAERVLDKDLSCTEVKQYWSRVRNQHQELFGHMAQLTMDESGAVICFRCKRKLI